LEYTYFPHTSLTYFEVHLQQTHPIADRTNQHSSPQILVMENVIRSKGIIPHHISNKCYESETGVNFMSCINFSFFYDN